jgi:hypothetical protein
MKDIRQELTEQFEKLAGEAGLVLISTPGEAWLIADITAGVGTRLHVRSKFDSATCDFVLSGQAVNAQDVEFFRSRHLIRELHGNHDGHQDWQLPVRSIGYADGSRIGKVLGAVRDLLAPFAVPSSPARPPTRRGNATCWLPGPGRTLSPARARRRTWPRSASTGMPRQT